MKIGIDIRYALHTRRGIGSYILNLIDNLAAIDKINQYFLYTDVDDVEGVMPQQDNFKVVKLSVNKYMTNRTNRDRTKSKLFAIWEQILLPIQAHADNLDILHCLGNTAPLYLHSSIRLILTVHDVMFAIPSGILPKTKSFYSTLFNQYCAWLLPRIVRRSVTTVTVSNYSMKDIINYTKIEPPLVQVIYPGIDPRFKKAGDRAIEDFKEKFNLKTKFILAFGAPDPRKNTITVLNAFLNFCKTNRDRDLVIAGVSDTYKTTIIEHINSSDFKHRITILPFVNEEDLVSLYNAADLVLYPSLYEGCGFPVLESMACGTPVIAANVTSIPEVAGDAAILVDPLNIDQITNALIKLSSDDNLRQTLIEKGDRQALNFSWRRTAEENLNIYNSIDINKSINN
jgi:glycosyltransferase involved in cell wall biosynthesis